DGTADIGRSYAAADPRIRYFRQPTNTGAAENHNFVFRQAKGEYYKWASHDDLYGRDLLLRCVQTLEENPQLVLTHAWQAIIGADGEIIAPVEYPLTTDSPDAPERFRSMLFGVGGDDFYGVIRSDVLRRTNLQESYHHADRVITAELALYGAFAQVPETLYFRRDHPDRAERATPSMRARCANLDPRRANRLHNPPVRLVAEYLHGFVRAIRRAPLSSADRRRCYLYFSQWLASRALPGSARRMEDQLATASGEYAAI
ncbi:MAG: glycosyltransferase, partial [Actinophytocola sp.]|nr:glycosyltransferase [Actinophytocola sp.]